MGSSFAWLDLGNAWMLLPVSLVALVLGCLIVWIARIPLSYNLRNLKVRYRTTLLTAAAFTMVIGVLTLMMGFINGLRVLTLSSGNPLNVVVLAQGQSDEATSNMNPTDMVEIADLPLVARSGEEPFCSREAYLIISQPILDPPPGRPIRRLLQMRGTDDPEMSGKIHGFDLASGTWFSEAGVQASSDDGFPSVEVVLGEGIARELGADRSPERLAAAKNPERLDVGDLIPLEQRSLLVVGVMKSGGTTFDSEVWAKKSVVGPLFGKQNYTTLILRAKDAPSATALEDFLTGKNPDNKYEKSQVNALTEPNYFKSLGQTNLQLIFGTAVVALVMAFGGVMGVMNTMFAAISQRIKDIGILRLLGFASWRILISFLVESVVIALIGGLLGCAIGYLFHGYSMTSTVGGAGPGSKTVVFRIVIDAGVVGIGIFLSLLMGFFGGLIPALSAMRLRPLESLR
jgi:ABC-type antimicrobial peptide transport system permease subunit